MSTDLIREQQRSLSAEQQRTLRARSLRKRELRVKPEFEFREAQPARTLQVEKTAKLRRRERRRRRKHVRFSAGRGPRPTFLNFD